MAAGDTAQLDATLTWSLTLVLAAVTAHLWILPLNCGFHKITCPRGPWLMSGAMCGFHNWGAPGMEWVEARDALQCPAAPRTAGH
jgi:hypothetical protein